MTNPRPRRTAFTLLELMISIALALLLILGINAVFSLTTRTVGAAQSVTTGLQETRAAHAVLSSDFRQSVPLSTAPCFIIECATQFAFRNRADLNADSDKKPATRDVVGGGAQIIPPNAWTDRSHRTDRIGFFARGVFTTQTGSNGAFIDTIPKTSSTGINVPVTSSEAWIVYGHLAVPDNSTTLSTIPNPATFPGVGTANPAPPSANPNNFYAAQWVLGRRVILLIPPPSQTGATYYDTGSTPLPPLGYQTPASGGANASGEGTVETSLHDVARTSIDTFTLRVTDYVASGAKPYYWDALVSDPTHRFVGNPLPTKVTTIASGVDYKRANQVAPCFLAGCTQFAVEFTGDFITQQNDPSRPNYGRVLSGGSDGVPDYQILPDGTRQVRWYGLPRLTSNNPNGFINPNVDVAPVHDTLVINSVKWPSVNGQAPAQVAPFERELPASVATGLYGSVTATDRYVVAWGPDTQAAAPPTPTPTMLRITIMLDDMSNRTGGGQTFEYIVQLQQ